jgi:hypothetical protein
MKIEVIKPNESAWKFPCKGRSKDGRFIVGFTKEGEGVVLETKTMPELLYKYDRFMNMDNFVPLEEEKEPTNWNKIECPIWAKDEKGNILIINSINNLFVAYSSLYIEAEKMVSTGQTFMAKKERNEWLNSLEILPKGSVIKITI